MLSPTGKYERDIARSAQRRHRNEIHAVRTRVCGVERHVVIRGDIWPLRSSRRARAVDCIDTNARLGGHYDHSAWRADDSSGVLGPLGDGNIGLVFADISGDH